MVATDDCKADIFDSSVVCFVLMIATDDCKADIFDSSVVCFVLIVATDDCKADIFDSSVVCFVLIVATDDCKADIFDSSVVCFVVTIPRFVCKIEMLLVSTTSWACTVSMVEFIVFKPVCTSPVKFDKYPICVELTFVLSTIIKGGKPILVLKTGESSGAYACWIWTICVLLFTPKSTDSWIPVLCTFRVWSWVTRVSAWTCNWNLLLTKTALTSAPFKMSVPFLPRFK